MGYRQAPAKAVLDRIEGLVASDVRLRVEEFDGEFILGPRSHILRRLLSEGFYEPELVQLFLSHLTPDRDVVDVGANVGFFSVLAAKRLTTGRVLAAEPTTAAFSRLSQNVTINDVETKVILYNGLVSNEASLATLDIVPGREEYSSMGGIVHPSVAGQAVQTETVQARPLDSLVAENGLRPAVIKVDVEGAEAWSSKARNRLCAIIGLWSFPNSAARCSQGTDLRPKRLSRSSIAAATMSTIPSIDPRTPARSISTRSSRFPVRPENFDPIGWPPAPRVRDPRFRNARQDYPVFADCGYSERFAR